MRRLLLIGLLAALVANVAAPAFGGDTALQRILKLDKREAKHYKALDKRLRLATNAILLEHISSTIASKPMTQNPNNTRSFSGSVLCPTGYTLSGGGADWGGGLLYPGWEVVESNPDPGGVAWKATVYNGNTGGSGGALPKVYAVCIKA